MAHVMRNKSGNWEARTTLGSDSDGRRRYRQKTFPGSLSEREAKQRADAWEARLRGSSDVMPATMTLSAWLGQYVDDEAARGASPTTVDTHRCYLRNQVEPWIGEATLDMVTASVANRWTRDLLSHGNVVTGEGLSPRTVNRVSAFVSGAFALAVEEGLVEHNPFRDARRAREVADEAQVMADDDVARLLAWCAGERNETAIAARLCLATGLRRGELCGLAWDDLMPESRSLHVAHTLQQTSSGLVLKPPKSKAGRRTMRLDGDTWEWLLRWRAAQAAREGPHVRVVSMDGSDTRPGLLDEQFARAMTELGMAGRGYHLHTLRHTHASRLLRSGVDVKQVQARMGHATATLTLNVYGHLIPGSDDRAAQATAAELGAALGVAETLRKD